MSDHDRNRASDAATETDRSDHASNQSSETEYEFSLDPEREAVSEQAETPPAQAQRERELEDVLAQVEVLQEENRRLRTDYVRARQSQYRQAAIALSVFSGIAGLGGLVFPASRPTLFGLAGIGIVIAILLAFVTPHRTASATVGERAYATFALLGRAISSDLGLQDTHIYVPTPTESGPGRLDAQLFIPLHTAYTVPTPEVLTSVFVVQTDEQTRGVAIPPTGALLLREFRQTMVDDLATTPTALTDQVTEGLQVGFDLADEVAADLDADAGRVTLGIQGSTFGAVDRFDHPVASFIATSLAVGLQTPVELTALTTDGEFEYRITCTWDPTEAESDDAP